MQKTSTLGLPIWAGHSAKPRANWACRKTRFHAIVRAVHRCILRWRALHWLRAYPLGRRHHGSDPTRYRSCKSGFADPDLAKAQISLAASVANRWGVSAPKLNVQVRFPLPALSKTAFGYLGAVYVLGSCFPALTVAFCVLATPWHIGLFKNEIR